MTHDTRQEREGVRKGGGRGQGRKFDALGRRHAWWKVSPPPSPHLLPAAAIHAISHPATPSCFPLGAVVLIFGMVLRVGASLERVWRSECGTDFRYGGTGRSLRCWRSRAGPSASASSTAGTSCTASPSTAS
eukprot:2407027-Rhodomonas_salina.1